MNAPGTPPQKKSLLWVWLIVLPVLLAMLFCIFFGPFLMQESVVRRLEQQGVEIRYRPFGRSHALQVIPGFEHYNKDLYWIKIGVIRPQQTASLPELLNEIRKIDGPSVEIFIVDLTGSDDLAQDLGSLPANREISVVVRDREISLSAMQQLKKTTKLSTLRLQNCKFENRALAEIGNCSNLIDLNLDGSTVTDEDMRAIDRLPNIRFVSLSNTQVSDAAKENLSRTLPDLNLTDD